MVLAAGAFPVERAPAPRMDAGASALALSLIPPLPSSLPLAVPALSACGLFALAQAAPLRSVLSGSERKSRRTSVDDDGVCMPFGDGRPIGEDYGGRLWYACTHPALEQDGAACELVRDSSIVEGYDEVWMCSVPGKPWGDSWDPNDEFYGQMMA